MIWIVIQPVINNKKDELYLTFLFRSPARDSLEHSGWPGPSTPPRVFSGETNSRHRRLCINRICCCCLLCNHCSNWTWVVEEIFAFGTRLRSTHFREFNYLKLCRPAYLVTTAQLLSIQALAQGYISCKILWCG